MFPLFFLQRHFCVFAISFPGADALKTIYLNILNAHLTYMDMGSALLKISERVVEAAVAFNSKVHGPINLDLYKSDVEITFQFTKSI